MSPRTVTLLRASLRYAWLLPVAVYLFVQAVQAVSSNYQSRQQIAELEARLEDLRLEKERLAALQVYLQTDAYREKELRRSLLLVRPGEKAYVLPESGNPRPLEEVAARPRPVENAPVENQVPIWRQWVDYLL